MNFTPEPQIIKPFSQAAFEDLQRHIKEVRRLFDWPGIPLHDAEQPPDNRFNRWYWHNLPLLKFLHNKLEFAAMVSKLAGLRLKPSYAFLSLYNSDGVCPPHNDRPQCQFTVDLCVNQDAEWPIYVEEKPYSLKPGEALFYSGTGQKHYRKPMKEDSKATYIDLAFFHWLPETWMGRLE